MTTEKFSFDTIQDFDEHINKSIPSYDVMIDAIKNISQYFIADGKRVYDLGCSTGKLLTEMDSEIEKIGYDNSSLLPWKSYKNLQFIKCDLNKNFDIKNACLVYSIFTMQFLDKSARQNYCNIVYDGLEKGGAFIICEKVYSKHSIVQEMMTLSYYQHKRNNFDVEEILDKEKDLRKIMKPNTMSENMILLKNSGFQVIESFWQSYNFIGLICIKS